MSRAGALAGWCHVDPRSGRPRQLRAVPLHARPKPRHAGTAPPGRVLRRDPRGLGAGALAPGRDGPASARSSTALTLLGFRSASAPPTTWGRGTNGPTSGCAGSTTRSIFVLIAGTYTPFCMLVLTGALGTATSIDRVGGSRRRRGHEVLSRRPARAVRVHVHRARLGGGRQPPGADPRPRHARDGVADRGRPALFASARWCWRPTSPTRGR